MKKVIFGLLIVLLLSGSFVVYMGIKENESTKDKVEATAVKTFETYFTIDVLQDVPAMLGDNMKIGSAGDYGAGNYVIDVNGSTLEDYQAYLLLLEKEKFTKYADNGEKGLYESVYNATYTKNDLVVTVVHVVKAQKTYISVAKELPLSEHLIYKDEYTESMIEGAKTSLSMMELYDFGNSFVIQLKNGHFVISDGGVSNDAPYLLDYMESLVPEGEKPVVEAWFITHAHWDHAGVLKEFVDHQEYAQRLFVEGIYYNEPSARVFDMYGPETRAQVTYLKMAANILKTTKGSVPQIYRPQTGQRYYFCDIILDVVFAQEQLHLGHYAGDFNDSSTWCMLNIEGQKVLLTADGDDGGMDTIARIYDAEDFKVDVFSVPHHALNVRNSFTDFCEPSTVLYTTWKTENFTEYDYYKRVEENEYLKEVSKEWYTWANGTVVLDFPYKVGEAVVLPEIQWIYDNGVDYRGNK